MSCNTYALSIVAAIFLPLGFLTGLLGINVGGMPGLKTRRRSESSWCCV
ncbi:MAG: CorA family divalent cation transporter [Rhizobiaceae bacterium]